MGWTEPRTWTNNEVVTDVIMNVHVRDNLSHLKTELDSAKNNSNTHINTKHGVHGLPSGTYLLGCRQHARRLEYAQASAPRAESVTLSVSWPASFSAIHSCMVCVWSSNSQGVDTFRTLSYSATGATQALGCGSSAATIYGNFWAIGT